MDVQAVREEIATVLATITGLHTYPFDVGSVQAPAALPGWPDRVEYVQSYQRYQTRVPDMPVLLLVGKSSERAAAKKLGQYVAESGSLSIPAKLEAREGSWTTCDHVTVQWVAFPSVSYGGAEYLAAEFHLDITGKGV